MYGCTVGFTMRNIGNNSVYKGCTTAYRVQYRYAAVHQWKACQSAGYAECTPVHQKRLNFPYSSFQLCLDFSGRRIYCKAEKENGVTARRSSLPLSESLSAKSPHFLFSDLELEALVVDKERASGKRGLQRGATPFAPRRAPYP